MIWANLSPADRVAHLEALVRQALHAGKLSKQAAEAIYALGQRLDLSVDEQRLLRILNDAILQGDVDPDQTVAPLFPSPDVSSVAIHPDSLTSLPSP